MSDKSLITSLDEAKAALDEEIASAQDSVNHNTINAANAKAQLDRAEGILWRLKSIRRRMDPPEVPQTAACMAVEDVVAVAEAA